MRFWIKQGNRDPALVATLTNDRGEIRNTTDDTAVHLIMRDRSDNTVVLDEVAEFLSPRNQGQVKYDWAEGDTALDGMYDAEFVVDPGLDTEQTFPGEGTIEVIIGTTLSTSENDPVTGDMLWRLRMAVGEVGETTFVDTQFADALARRDMELEAAAYDIWTWKAAEYANLVTTKDGDGTRNLSDLLKNAQTMIKMYADRSAIISGEVVESQSTVRFTRTRRIVRE